MINKNVSHWRRNKYFEGLLLFAQALAEGTFYYSYESYKLPALNSHYLCYDIVHTASDIERKVLMDGNFIPLAEEFEQMLKEDLFIKKKSIIRVQYCILKIRTVIFLIYQLGI